MFSRLPPVTQALLIANTALFLLQLMLGQSTFAPFMLWPLGGFDPFSPGENFQPWQLLTYGFLHASFGHLLFNMLAVYMFGAPLELTWGPRRFLAFYLISVAGAGLCQLAVGWWITSGGGGRGRGRGGLAGRLLRTGRDEQDQGKGEGERGQGGDSAHGGFSAGGNPDSAPNARSWTMRMVMLR